MAHPETSPAPSQSPATAPERVYRGLNAEQRAGGRRQRLVQAGIDLYGTAGYHATSVKAICQHAGLTERYFYESFANSETLLCACCAELMEEQRHHARQAAEQVGGTLASRMQAAAESYAIRLRANPAAAHLTLFEMEGVSRRVDAFLQDELTKTARFIEAIVFTDLQPDNPRQLQAPLLAIGLMGALYQLAKEWTRTGFALPAEEIARHIEALTQGVALCWLGITQAAPGT